MNAVQCQYKTKEIKIAKVNIALTDGKIVDVDWNRLDQMYEPIKELNAKNVLKLLNENIEKLIDSNKFLNICKETFEIENEESLDKVMTMEIYVK